MLKYEEEIKVWLWQLNRKALVVVVMVFVRVFFNVLWSGLLHDWQDAAKVTSEAMIRSGHYFKWKEYLAVTQKEKGCELATKYLCDNVCVGSLFQGITHKRGTR